MMIFNMDFTNTTERRNTRYECSQECRAVGGHTAENIARTTLNFRRILRSTSETVDTITDNAYKIMDY